MMGLRTLFLASRLAWRQLTHERAKLVAATLGVLFACVLVFMQLGFRDSLITSAGSAPLKMRSDLFLLHKQSEALWRTVTFNRSELMRTLAHPQVVAVYPLYMGLGQFKNPETQTKRTLMVYGGDPDAHLIASQRLYEHAADLRLPDHVMFDEASRPEFGPIAKLLADGRNVTEINDRKVTISGMFRMGTSFAADGNVVTSDNNFMRIFPNRRPDQVDVGFIRLKPGSNVLQVQAELTKKLNETVYVFTFDQLVKYEQDYWNNNAPIGLIFGFGVVMGLVVGMVIVYQILFTDITNHLNEYATLKAMGYKHRYLVMVVFASAFFLAVLGFTPGFLISLWLYHMAEQAIYIPFPMPLSKVITVFNSILGMCGFAGLLAIRKLRAANPADLF